MGGFLLALLVVAIPVFRLWRKLQGQIDELHADLQIQRQTMGALLARLERVEKSAAPAPSPPAPSVPKPAAAEPARPAPAAPAPVRPEERPVMPPPPPAAPPPVTPPIIGAAAGTPPVADARPIVPGPRRPEAPIVDVPRSPGEAATPPPLPAESPGFGWAAFDWEQLVGVKLFSGIAGIALVLAAVFFFRYSLDRGWLAPPVRVAIGVIVATALLVVCELRAARRYRVTANALDASAIAILFATFFAAHALWDLIPSTATFGLLALVTVLAVLLSIRHEAIFIAILGLLGGFATPALLSTGENQPIPLFTYLLLLNIGLAWVAVRMKWPVLTILTLVLTTLYQWGWVARFLAASDLPLGMGIFLVFSVTSFVALALGRRAATADGRMDLALEQSGLAASAMPLAFALFLAAVPQFGVHTGLLFGFLLIVVLGLSSLAIARRDDRLYAMGGLVTVLVFAVWLATSYAAGAWRTVVAFAVVFVGVYAMAPLVAERLRRPMSTLGVRVGYVAPVLLFVFAVIVRVEPQTATSPLVFAALFAALALIAWRAFAAGEAGLYFVAAFFAVATEASWSATHLTPERLAFAIALYSGFAIFYLGVPLVWRRAGGEMHPRWGGGAVLIASLLLLLFLAAGPHAAAAVWGLALLLAILDAGLFIESASGAMPILSTAGALLSWVVLAIWWANAAAAVGVFPSLLVLVGLTLIMFAGHAWAHARTRTMNPADNRAAMGFRLGLYLGLVGQLFLFYFAQEPRWAVPPWPLLGALVVMTLATTASSLSTRTPQLHAGGVVAAALVVLSLSPTLPGAWALTVLAAAELVVTYAIGTLALEKRDQVPSPAYSLGAVAALFVTEFTLISAAHAGTQTPLPVVAAAHVLNLSLILWLAWRRRWPFVAESAVLPAWAATIVWQDDHQAVADWSGTLAFATVLYAVFAAYPLVLNRRARQAREPYVTAILGGAFFFFAARGAFLAGEMRSFIGIVPVAAGIVTAVILRQLLRIEAAGERDLGRLALVAATALAFATVAIPLQLSNQWITIGWALEGAALAWLYRRIPHKGLLAAAAALMAVVFVRLVLNPAVFVYQPRGSVRFFNWYLYAYATCAGAMMVAARWLSTTDDRMLPQLPRTSVLLTPAAVIVLFLLLNIEVADFYATGPEITFRFGVTVAQDLTYTIGWLLFGLAMLAFGIYARNRYGRIAAVALIAITTSKAFLYDLGSLGGLYRVGSLVGLAVSLSLVALALQKFVLLTPKEQE